MTRNIEENDEILIINQNWNKFEEKASKLGYSEGIAHGKESNFQKYFDDGFREGFKNGFCLGFTKGILSTNNEAIADKTFQKTSSGNCLICKKDSLEHKPMPEVINLQSDSTLDLLKTVDCKYSSKISISVPKSLD